MNEITLPDRMKEYEKSYDTILPRKLPLVLRIDGRYFSKLLKGLKKPFDNGFFTMMNLTTTSLIKKVQKANFAYVNSDEINLLLASSGDHEGSTWVGNRLQKMISISTSLVTASFNALWAAYDRVHAYFECHAVALPKEEVCNYFVWRQSIAITNSIQMAARSIYSHNECLNKTSDELKAMLASCDNPWEDIPLWYQRGRCILVDKDNIVRLISEIPLFKDDREFIERYIIQNNNLKKP